MPRGVDVVVDKGFALIDFTDPALKYPMLRKLHDLGTPIAVDTSGRRKRWRVPVGNAEAAGLIDVPKSPRVPKPPAPAYRPVVERSTTDPAPVQQPPVKRRPGRPRKRSLGG